MTTTTRTGALRARWAGLLLAALAAVLAMLLPAGTASASGHPAAETRVGAIHPTTSTVVGVAEHIAAGQRRSRAPSQLQVVSGHCVAAEAASPGTALVKYSYPPNRGFMGSPVRTTLKPGTVVDRYGANSGTFVSPQGTSFAQRSLPPSSLNKPFNTYEVVNPIDVHAGTVAPWFGQGGGGIQYEFGQSIADLIEGGFLKVVG